MFIVAVSGGVVRRKLEYRFVTVKKMQKHIRRIVCAMAACVSRIYNPRVSVNAVTSEAPGL